MTRAEARTGHERSEKNVPVARFGARVRVAALSAASEPRRRLGCAAHVVSSDWPSHLCLPVRTHPKNRLAFPAAGSASAFLALVVSANVRPHSGRPLGHFLKTASLFLPLAALQRFLPSSCQPMPVPIRGGHWDTSLKPPRFICHRRRFGDFPVAHNKPEVIPFGMTSGNFLIPRRPAYPAAAPPPIRRTAWPAPAGWRCWGLPRRSPIC